MWVYVNNYFFGFGICSSVGTPYYVAPEVIEDFTFAQCFFYVSDIIIFLLFVQVLEGNCA